jgi:hypothetical protein
MDPLQRSKHSIVGSVGRAREKGLDPLNIIARYGKLSATNSAA